MNNTELSVPTTINQAALSATGASSNIQFIERDTYGSDHWTFSCTKENLDSVTEEEFDVAAATVAIWCRNHCQESEWSMHRAISSAEMLSLDDANCFQCCDCIGNAVDFVFIFTDYSDVEQFRATWC